MMPIEKNSMGFIHSFVPVQEEFPSKDGNPLLKGIPRGEIWHRSALLYDMYNDPLKMGIMKCILL